MRVHQPGFHLSRGQTSEVEDWSWRRTRRRLGTLYRLGHPYKARTGLALVSLLGVTAASLLLPYLVGRTVDEVQQGNTSELTWLVSAFLAAGVLGVVLGYAQTYFTGWTGERMLADLRELVFGHLRSASSSATAPA
jgi:ABC-type multidrug transport system fused ATPase/permease subunit